jgi:hypothetical protein
MKETAIYGAGVYGKVFLFALRKEGIKVDYFIDELFDKSIYQEISVYKIPIIKIQNFISQYFNIQKN